MRIFVQVRRSVRSPDFISSRRTISGREKGVTVEIQAEKVLGFSEASGFGLFRSDHAAYHGPGRRGSIAYDFSTNRKLDLENVWIGRMYEPALPLYSLIRRSLSGPKQPRYKRGSCMKCPGTSLVKTLLRSGPNSTRSTPKKNSDPCPSSRREMT